MEIQEFRHDDYVTLCPVGDLDAQSSINMDEKMQQLIQEKVTNIHIDGSQLAYISSAGLGVFISFLDEISSQGGKMIFSNLSAEVKDVFELLGLSSLVTIVDQAQSAAPIFQS